MPEILSQSQIDELLSSLQRGEDIYEKDDGPSFNGKKVKDYDFKSPKRLTKEQLKILTGIHESFARNLALYFAGILRLYSEINILSIEEQPYYEYNNALPDSILIGVLDVPPIEGGILIDISNSITFSLIERLLGGGSRENSLMPEREFTEIEISLMERVFKQIAAFTKDAWSGLPNSNASLKQIETNSRLMQSISMDEIVVIIVMNVSIGPIKGTINFCIPCINIESILDQLSQSRYNLKRLSESGVEAGIKNHLTAHVRTAPLELKAVFGGTTLSLKEVANLQVGDVIKLDQTLDSHMKLNIEGKTWFSGDLGLKKNKKAIKISKVL